MFRVGITPDFYTEAKGRFEAALASKLEGIPGLEYAAMPLQPGNVATPEALDQFDAIFALALKITRESVRGVERLALVARWGVGYDMIDVEALTEAGVLLAITPQAVRRPVAEAILTLIFALAKNLIEQDRIMRQGRWRTELRDLGCTLAGKTLGSLGLGNIGSEMFRLCASLGFGRRIAYDPFVDPIRARSLGVELTGIEELFQASDFLAINCPLNAQTRGLVGERLLRLMKPAAYLINTARGAILDEAALVRALSEGWIAGAGLDVFEREPPAPDHPLRQLPNVVLAPHALAWTHELTRDNGLEACDNILALARGEVPRAIVNPDVLEQPGFQRKLARYRRQP